MALPKKVAMRNGLVLLVMATLLLGACQRGCAGGVRGDSGSPRAGNPRTGSTTTGESSATEDITVGEPATFGNLTVFPLLRQRQTKLGNFTSLEAAVRTKQAEIRELGSEADGTSEGAEVNQLVIDNRGDLPIYVLAGTIVKGGKQDRQIAQDFIAAAHDTTKVGAFCVEHGRWSSTRRGSETGGRFTPIGQLATKTVRAAAQYDQNQAQVWSKVGALNASNQKLAPTGTLLATLEDSEVQGQREALKGKLVRFLGAVRPEDSLVGVAYAIHGKVESVRWFAQHSLFELFEDTLLATAATDAITNRSAPSSGPVAPVTREAVRRFMAELDAAPEQERRAATRENTNAYAAAARGYRSKTMVSSPAASAAPISADYTSR